MVIRPGITKCHLPFVIASLCLTGIWAALIFGDAWQDDFTGGTSGNTEVISDSVQLAEKTDWWKPSENWWNPSQNWWDSSYQYRKAININNTGSSLSDYQVKVENPVYNETSLIGSWHFEEVAGTISGSVADSSGNGKNGTLTNFSSPQGIVSSGKFGNALNFDGTGDYVNVGTSLIGTGGTNYTVEVWFNTPDQVAGFRELVSQWTNATSGNAFFLGTASNDDFRVSDNWININIGTWTTNEWHHLACISTTTNAYLYFDGILKAVKGSALSYTGTGPVIIGRQGEFAGGEYWNGSIDEVRIYNRVLSDVEIKAHYDAKAKLNYGDIRFVNTDGTAEFPYFMQKDGTFYVKFSSSNPLATGLNSVFLYYGNSIAATTSNFANTMEQSYAYESGLVSQYLFTEGSGSTAGDSEGTNTGTLINMEPADWVAGKYNNYALEFDGTNETVSLPSLAGVDTVTANAKTTVEFWMYWTGADDKMPFGWNGYNLYLRNNFFGFNTANGDVYGISSTGLSNKWVHVAAIFNNGSVTSSSLYINGASQTLSQLQGAPLSKNVTSSANISGWPFDALYRIGGKIDDVRIYSRALTADEASAHYQCRKSVSPEPALYIASEITSTSSWQYRKAVTINNTNASALTDYQMKIENPIYNETGLVSWWHFEEGTGLTAADTGSNANNGTITIGAGGSQTTLANAWSNGSSGKFGRGIRLDGTDDYITLGQAGLPSGTSARSIEGWVKLAAEPSNWCWVVSYGTAAISNSFFLGFNNDLVSFGGYGDDVTYTPNLAPYVNQWVYLAGTYDGVTARLYFNGALVSSGAKTWNVTLSKAYIGRQVNDSEYINGTVDEVRIYNRVLSQSEISEHYVFNKCKSDYSDVRFTDSSGVELPYWMERDGVFWTKPASVPAGLSNIFVYYGNASAVSGSSTAGTFIREISNLQGAWQFEEPAGTITGTTADASGQNRNGTLSGFSAGNGIISAGKYSNGVKLNGSSTSVDLGTWFNYQTFTIAMWVSAGSTQLQYTDLIDNNHSNWNWTIEQNSTLTNQYYWSTDGGDAVAINLTADAWTHLVIARNGTSRTSTVYFNNSPSSSTGTGNITYNNPLNLMLGRWVSGGRNWNGLMDSVFMFDKTLSATEVSDLYNNCGFSTRAYPGKLLIRKYTAIEPAVASMGSEVVPSSTWLNRQKITINTVDAATSGYSVKADADIESLRVANKVQNDLDDLRVVAYDRTGGVSYELDRDIARGQAISLNGSSQYINVGNIAAAYAQISVEAWFKSNSTSNEQQLITKDDNGANRSWDLLMNPGGTNPGKIYAIFFGATSGYTDFMTTATFNDNNWHHVAVVFSASTPTVMSFYVDGVSAPASSYSATNFSGATVKNTTANVWIGARSNNAYFWNGLIDEVRISNIVRYSQNFAPKQTMFTTDANTFGLWHLDSNAADASDNGNNGTLSGSPYYAEGKVTAVNGIGKELSPATTTGLLGLWHMNESSWNGTANEVVDSSGNGNHGTANNGATTASGAKLGAYSGTFDGTNDFVNVPHNSNLNPTTNNPYTYELWLYFNSLPSTWKDILQKNIGTGNIDEFYIRTNNASGMDFGYSTTTRSGGLSITYANLGIFANNWYHIAFVVDGTNSYVYVNGVLRGQLTLTVGSYSGINTNALTIGGFTWDGYPPVKIDEFAIYNRSLPASEIREHYNARNEVWFKTQSAVNASSTSEATGQHSYYLYYNNSSAGTAIENKSNVYQFFDDFSADRWTDTGSLLYADTTNQRLYMKADRSSTNNRTYIDRSSVSNTSWELDLKFRPIGSSGTQALLDFGYFSALENRYNASGDAIFFTYNNNVLIVNRYMDGGSASAGTNITTAVNTDYYILMKRISDTQIKTYVYLDAARTAEVTGSPVTTTIPGSVTGLRYLQAGNYNDNVSAGSYVEAVGDDVLARAYTANEPVLFLGGEGLPYNASGTFTSSVKNTGENDTKIDSVSWTATGAGTLTMEIRADNSDPGGWSDSAPSWESADNGDTTITATGKYIQYRATFTGAGTSAEPVLTDITVTYTVPVIPPTDSVSCDRLNSTWYSTAVFTFTNDTGFGVDIDRYYYAWNNTVSYTFTLGESVWDSSTPPATAPQLLNSATADGSWYFHYLPYSSTDTPGTAQDLGPFYYDGTAPAAASLLLPANNGSVSTSTAAFSWQPVTDMSGIAYTLQMDYYTFFGSPLVNKTGLSSESYTLNGTAPEKLVGSTAYYWRVITTDGAGNSTNSAYQKFTTTSAIPLITNTMTGESYSTLQEAIDGANTVDGDVIRIQDTVAHNENITITKDIALENAILSPSSGFAVTGQGASGGEVLRNCVITAGGVMDLALGENLTIYDPDPSAVATIQNSKLINCLIESGTIVINSELENCYIIATADYFIDAAGGDFHLSNTAANAIDKGKNLSAEFTDDMDEAERGIDIWEMANFDTAAWDMGAYELKIETGYLNLPQAPSVPAEYFPADGSANMGVDVFLIWYPSTGSTPLEYAVQVSTSADMSNPYYSAANIADTFKEINGLTEDTIYYWQVKASNGAGDSAWSAVYDFTTQADTITLPPGATAPESPSVPVLSYPENNVSSLDNNIVFVWYPSTGTAPVTYSLELAMAEDMNLVLYAIGGIEDAFLQISSLPYNTPFYWRVKAVNDVGESAWSGVWEFSILADGGTETMYAPSVPVLSSPADNAEISGSVITFQWYLSSGTGSITYDFQASTSADFAESAANYTNITGGELEVTSDFSYNVNYYWRVRAHNENGYSDWSSARVFARTQNGSSTTTVQTDYYSTSNSTSGTASQDTVRQKGGCFIKMLGLRKMDYEK
ncbi:MAG: DUF2341 domain-containing protein [Planctomycetes bacterium]|nr:DUF2341 domain-containing protein [Planctomycetota bacterium]